MLKECINIFIYLQHTKRKQRAVEFPGRAQHFFGCNAVKSSPLTMRHFFPGCRSCFNTCRPSDPSHHHWQKCIYTVGEINQGKLTILDLKAHQGFKEINKYEASLVFSAVPPFPNTLIVSNVI